MKTFIYTIIICLMFFVQIMFAQTQDETLLRKKGQTLETNQQKTSKIDKELLKRTTIRDGNSVSNSTPSINSNNDGIEPSLQNNMSEDRGFKRAENISKSTVVNKNEQIDEAILAIERKIQIYKENPQTYSNEMIQNLESKLENKKMEKSLLEDQ